MKTALERLYEWAASLGDVVIPAGLENDVKAAIKTGPRVLIQSWKHGKNYYDATGRNLGPAALEALQFSVEAGYIWSVEDTKKYIKEPAPPDLSREQIAALPDGEIKQFAEKQVQRYERDIEDRREAILQAEQTERALANRDGRLAWKILQERSDYEYEHVFLEQLEQPGRE